jgi:hypothetical protein
VSADGSVSPRSEGAGAALVTVTAALTALRVYAAFHVGFGDSEALYASYALHPQAAYVDHPGLVGAIARMIGGGSAPGPAAAHLFTTLVAGAIPWEMVLACLAAGATRPRALAAGLLVAAVPEVAVGLFALTPDSILSVAWIGALGLAAWGLRRPRGDAAASRAFFAAGALGGVAGASKLSGGLLLVALGATYASRPARVRSCAAWAGLALGGSALLPVVLSELRAGAPMLRHRLIETQAGAGPSLRNLGALAGGQLVYLSPLVAVLAVRAAWTLWRDRAKDPAAVLLWWSAAIPAAVLAPLCLWSRVAEPHWMAPALLALVPAAARAAPAPPRRLVIGAVATGAAMIGAVYAWVLVPSLLRFAPASYDARLDIANELQGWPEVVEGVRSAVRAVRQTSDPSISIVGPHWVICAQLEAALRGEVPVGCDTPIPDDFDVWWPRDRWRRSRSIVWVSDARFGPPPAMPDRAPIAYRDVSIVRAGRVVRSFSVTTLAALAAP